ncbi:MAG TPA: CocE/NonD family hydrolase [Thermoleophilaceae bacterium]|nr:CocE/NonD family hydrolase [Thermoleophilaceae bacterium]
MLVLPAAAQAQAETETVYETLSVPTVDGDFLHVEIARPAGQDNVPVILTYSPYNSLSEGTTPNLANDDLGQRYVARGYARAVADVLGTRNSSGCWDYGGLKEQQSGVDLVNALSGQSWSNGNVAMIGGSYDGTTANMVAARGADAPGLKAIVPELAISRWHGYAYGSGVRYFGNSERPTDEGVDTPLAFDFGIARTPPTQPTPQLIDAMRDRLNPCDAAEHTERGYDTSPDYDSFWLERDYRKDARRFRASTLVVHGWQDYNVKQSEGVDLYEALRLSTTASATQPFKHMYMFQGGHQSPSGERFQPVLDQFFDTTLKGAAPGPDLAPPVITQGRDSTAPGEFREERSWPPVGMREARVSLGREATGGTLTFGRAGRSDASYTDSGANTEETARRALDAEAGWLAYKSAPLRTDARIAGTPRLERELTADRDSGQVSPTLVDIAPDGSAKTLSRGHLNLRYRNGLGREQPVPPGRRVSGTVLFSPQDHTVRVGHRLGLIVAGSNTVWAVPNLPAGGTYTVHHGGGGSRLVLPLAP